MQVLFGAAWPKPFEAQLLSLTTVDFTTATYTPASLHVYAMNDDINPPEMAMQVCRVVLCVAV